MKKGLVIGILAIMCTLQEAAAGSWYVDNTAGGANSGTSWTNAWNGFSKIVWGASGVKAGDTLFISGGATSQVYTEGISIGASGSAGAFITIRPGKEAGHNGTVIIDCQNTINTAMALHGCSYITIDGVRGDAMAGDTAYGMKFLNLAGGGVYSADGPTNINVFHVEFTGSQTTGGDDMGPVRISGGSIYEVAYCWIHGNEAGRTNKSLLWHVSGITIWANSTGTTYTSTRIHHNRVELLYHDGIKTGSNASIYNNEVSYVHGSGHSDSIIDQSGSYCAIFNNYVHDSDDQNIYLDNLCDNTQGHIRIYNNVIINSAGFGLIIDSEGGYCTGPGSSWDDVVVANNTFYRTGGYVINTPNRGLGVTNLVIKNNIIGGVQIGGYVPIAVTGVTSFLDDNAFDYNVYLANGTSGTMVADWAGTQKAVGGLQSLNPPRETHGAYADPTFVNPSGNDFHLTAGDNTARDKGCDLSAYFTTDKDGNMRPQGTGWDVGAYEYGVIEIQKVKVKSQNHLPTHPLLPNPIQAARLFEYLWPQKNIMVYDLAGKTVNNNFFEQPGIYLIENNEAMTVQKVMVIK
jgi:hypothetical protein